MCSTFVVIPTYWTWPLSENGRPEKASFDHPTPIDGNSTLPHLLEDLCEQNRSSFRVLILTGLTNPDLAQDAANRVKTLVAPYRDRLDICICDAPTLERLKAVLESARLPHKGLNLCSYSGVRNLQLLVSHIMGARFIIALDDDERIKPDYAERALRYVDQRVDGQQVLGLSGPYMQPNGEVFLEEPPPTGNPILDKASFINDAMRALTNAEVAIVPSPLAFGGNMVFHYDLFTRVPFDPGITRGEDIDYVINARLQGTGWWFDAQLTILHLPPRHYETPIYRRMREDVSRFIYTREKLLLHSQNKPEWLDPYPGRLLGDDLIEHAISALQAEATYDMKTCFGDPQSIIELSQNQARHYAPLYQRFAQEWRWLAVSIERSPTIRLMLIDAIQRKTSPEIF